MTTPHPTVAQATKRLNSEVARSWREAGGCGLMEADDDVNMASRGVIKAMFREHGDAWLYEINRGLTTGVQYKGDAPLFNFCATIVMPRRVPAFEALVAERRATAYTSTRNDSALIEAIFECGVLHGGELLSWS